MPKIERRILLSGLAAAPLAAPSLLRAQGGASRPVQIGLISDMSGPFKDVGGPGNRVAAELAIQDFGGSVLGRPVTIRQADGQNRADISAQLAREWLDNQGVDALCDGAASSAGLAIQEIAREKKRIYLITGPATSDMTGSKCSPYGMHFGFDTYALRTAPAPRSPRPAATPGISSPPTTPSAMRWSATPWPPSAPMAAGCWARCGRR